MASLTEARRVVVKIGSALLVEEGRLRADWLASLAQDVAWLSGLGKVKWQCFAWWNNSALRGGITVL